MLVSAAELAAAVAEYRAAQQHLDESKASVVLGQERLKRARGELEAAVVEAARDGTRMKDLVAASGLSREWLRTLLRRNGIYAED